MTALIGQAASRAGDALVVFGLLGVILGGLIYVIFYIWGTIVAGNGQHLKATLDHADIALFWAGNYNDVGGRRATSEYVPKFILPSGEKK